MKMPAFSVRDDAVGAFLPPFFVRSKGEAIRSFTDAVADPGHQFARHKPHYILYAIGFFDDAGGVFIPTEPLRVISALEAVAPDDAPVLEPAPIRLPNIG
uniref:DNA binding protein VP5 n=1 Tax=Gokushovirinae environmental samples TaxID=1478972 RepID=A0A2R3UAB9_9VIRU|nr:DNA binding protein VP5 [Gokushovirinae environmental samples]